MQLFKYVERKCDEESSVCKIVWIVNSKNRSGTRNNAICRLLSNVFLTEMRTWTDLIRPLMICLQSEKAVIVLSRTLMDPE